MLSNSTNKLVQIKRKWPKNWLSHALLTFSVTELLQHHALALSECHVRSSKYVSTGHFSKQNEDTQYAFIQAHFFSLYLNLPCSSAHATQLEEKNKLWNASPGWMSSLEYHPDPIFIIHKMRSLPDTLSSIPCLRLMPPFNVVVKPLNNQIL